MPEFKKFLAGGALLGAALLSGCSASSDHAVPRDDAPLAERTRPYEQKIERLGGHVEIELDLSNTQITDDDLARLEFPDSVRSISLMGTKITNRGVAELVRAAGLRRLNLVATPVTEAVVDSLLMIPNLEDVTLQYTSLSEDEQLAVKRQLRERSASAASDDDPHLQKGKP